MGPIVPIRWDLDGLSSALPLLTDDPGEVLDLLLAVEHTHISILAATAKRKR